MLRWHTDVAGGNPPEVPAWPGTAAGSVICRGTSIYIVTTHELYPADRLEHVREATAAAGLDALLLTPGPDLRYVTGYDALPLERLTCLVVPAEASRSWWCPAWSCPRPQASPGRRARHRVRAAGTRPTTPTR